MISTFNKIPTHFLKICKQRQSTVHSNKSLENNNLELYCTFPNRYSNKTIIFSEIIKTCSNKSITCSIKSFSNFENISCRSVPATIASLSQSSLDTITKPVFTSVVTKTIFSKIGNFTDFSQKMSKILGFLNVIYLMSVLWIRINQNFVVFCCKVT